MARDFMAAMLDELMGRDRNVEPEKRRELTFEDRDVCKYFLVGYCPHDLFVNTKADLGPCKKIHDNRLKEKYEQSTAFRKLGYEDSFHHFLRDLLVDMDKKVKRANERVELTNKTLPSHNASIAAAAAAAANGGGGASALLRPDAVLTEEHKEELGRKISQLIAEANELGANGESDAAEAKMRELEKVKQERRALLDPSGAEAVNSILSVERKLEVCQVCGAYLVIGDAQQRIEDHLSGKQHSGFALVRRTLQEAEEQHQRERDERLKLRSQDLRPTTSDDDDDRKKHADDHDSRRRSRARDSHQRHQYEDRDRERGGGGGGDRRRSARRSTSSPRDAVDADVVDNGRRKTTATTTTKRRSSRSRSRSRSRDERRRRDRSGERQRRDHKDRKRS